MSTSKNKANLLKPGIGTPWIPYLETLMLFPDSPSLRREALMVLLNDKIVEKLIEQIKNGKGFSVDTQDMCRTLEFLRTSYPVEYYRNIKTPKRYKWGMVMGAILHNFVGWNDLNPTMARITGLIEKCSKSRGLSISTINNTILPKFKPVAHLWAAHVSYAFEGDKTFPCSATNLGAFLGSAEAYRKRGEQIIPKQYTKPFLDPKKTWKVPEDLELPEINLEFLRRQNFSK